jgi:hypothetical protein
MAISRDYTKEVGIASHKKTMPRPLAFAVLAFVAAGVSYGVVQINKRAKLHHEAEKPVAQQSASAPASGNGAAPASP